MILFFMQTSSAPLQRGPICKGITGITGTPIFEDAQLRHLNQPDLYFATVKGLWTPVLSARGSEPNGEDRFRPDPGKEKG